MSALTIAPSLQRLNSNSDPTLFEAFAEPRPATTSSYPKREFRFIRAKLPAIFYDFF